MIIVKDRKLLIPPSDKHLGFVGDNLAEKRIFVIKDEALFDMDFRADLQNTLETVYLTKQLSEDKKELYLYWDITAAAVKNEGTVVFQLRAFEANGEKVWHSEKEFFYVSGSIDVQSDLTEKEISEFEAIEKRVAELCNETKQYSESAKNYAYQHTHSAFEISEEYEKQFVTYEQKQLLNEAESHFHTAVNPHNVTASQVGAYTTGEVDGKISDVKAHLNALELHLGNAEAAVDAIIEIQESLIGEEIADGAFGDEGLI